jgi:hypothetical protein
MPGVIAHDDIGPCALDWCSKRWALVLACPGRDLVKV